MGTHMKTTIEISDPLLREARALAARQGQTLRQVVEAGLRQVVGAHKGRKQSFRLRDASVGGKGLRDGLHYDDWGKILDIAYGNRG
ncbi:MAG: type II toxin-antitoxin system VapB family antitoxin [Deltaproteobacteria bacterium]|nr:type II toxin-antitoxin system VapB family antitoxin [Deltaproteobacteria bacterium]